MKTRNTQILLAALCSVLLFSGCGKGFSTTGLNTPLIQENNSQLDTPSTPTTDPLARLDFKGQVDEPGEFNQKRVLDFDKQNGNFIIKLPLPFGFFVGVLEVSIPSLPGATMQSVSDETGNYLALSIPARYILHGVQFLPSNRLPNGQALPSIPSGELPTLAISLPGKNDMRVHLYLGVNVFAAYLELDKFNNPRLSIIPRLTFPVKSRDGLKIMGYLSLISPTQANPGGIFVATPIPAELAKIIDDYFPI